MFPTDKGESVSSYVSQVVAEIRRSGYPCQLTAMGTLVETDTIEQATQVVSNCYHILEPACNRVYTTLTMDIRKDRNNMLKHKVQAVEDRLTSEQ